MLDLISEKEKFASGYQLIGGVDEAGRGPLAGSVVAACVVIGEDFKIKGELEKVMDSKKLSAKKREELYKLIREKALAVEIGVVSPKIIDKINILQASLLAMKKAVDGCKIAPDYLFIDGKFKIPKTDIPQSAVIGGDGKVFCIAAASIIAKVARDWLISAEAEKYPEYEFARHKGYGTAIHLSKLKEFGPCPIHRKSFGPVKDCLKK
ncbi:MAG: ribonuclease HII [Candidatus Falkowbacteria bacterium]|nr:ribonuclease HII [Candidatus Falkowbacteria bacterium]